MISYFKKSIFIIINLITTHSAQAQILKDDVIRDVTTQTGVAGTGAGINTLSTVGSVLAIVIKAFFSVMGIVFLILILHAGYKWMNANGAEKDVDEAKDSIKRAVIGLAVMIAAYAITAFVFAQLDKAQ